MGFKVDGKELRAARRHYTFIELPSGLHHIKNGKDEVDLNVEAGKDYYFTMDEQLLGWGGYRLSPLSSEQGEFYLKNFKADKKQIASLN